MSSNVFGRSLPQHHLTTVPHVNCSMHGWPTDAEAPVAVLSVSVEQTAGALADRKCERPVLSVVDLQ